MDVRKEINFCKKIGLGVIGVVENMSGFVCPNCKGESIIFKPSTGGAKKMAEEMGVPFLGSVPLDPKLARACDEGKNFIEENPESPAVKAINSIIESKKLCVHLLIRIAHFLSFRNHFRTKVKENEKKNCFYLLSSNQFVQAFVQLVSVLNLQK